MNSDAQNAFEKKLREFLLINGLEHLLPNTSATSKHEGIQVGVFGKFDRGKSLLVNTLLGVDLLPTMTSPGQQHYIRIQNGATPSAAIHSAIGEVRPVEFAKLNLPSGERPAYLDIQYPLPDPFSPFTFYDVPGIEEASYRMAVESALAQSDVVIFVIVAGPPISEAERLFLTGLPAHVQKLVIVINRIDELDEPERATFVEKVGKEIQKLGLKISPSLYGLSAKFPEQSGAEWELFRRELAQSSSLSPIPHASVLSVADYRQILAAAEAQLPKAVPHRATTPTSERQKKNLQLLHEVIDEQASDIRQVLQDSLNVTIFEIERGLRYKTMTVDQVQPYLQDWLEKEQGRIKERLGRLYSRVLDDIERNHGRRIQADVTWEPLQFSRQIPSVPLAAKVSGPSTGDMVNNEALVRATMIGAGSALVGFMLPGPIGWFVWLAGGGLVALQVRNWLQDQKDDHAIPLGQDAQPISVAPKDLLFKLFEDQLVPNFKRLHQALNTGYEEENATFDQPAIGNSLQTLKAELTNLTRE